MSRLDHTDIGCAEYTVNFKIRIMHFYLIELPRFFWSALNGIVSEISALTRLKYNTSQLCSQA